MPCINDSNWIGNPNNHKYLLKAEALKMDWIVFRDMYKSLHPEVREELDGFIDRVYVTERRQQFRHYQELKNRPSRISKPTNMVA